MDFGALPPEINSTRMYSGPGSAPMLAAARGLGTAGRRLVLHSERLWFGNRRRDRRVVARPRFDSDGRGGHTASAMDNGHRRAGCPGGHPGQSGRGRL
jgi:PPE family